ncbi:MAG: hypothetical protein Q7T55_24795, partial [Solirubrobacteraceae bacterium]|nr:hypothetical protein [Solirubrobacteraceae bacterium]
MPRPAALLRRTAGALLAASAVAACTTSPAMAATAPLRFVGIAPDGKRTYDQNWVAISADGSELVGEERRQTESYALNMLSRSVVTGKTTVIVPGVRNVDAVSADLQRIIFTTKTSFSAKDRNSEVDLYLLDRRANTKTLLSVGGDGSAIGLERSGGKPYYYAWPSEISADGKVAMVSLNETDNGTPSGTRRTWLYDIDRASFRELPAAKDGYNSNLDRAGRVAISADQIVVDGQAKGKVPEGTKARWTISPNGKFAAAPTEFGDAVIGVDLENGQSVKIPLPYEPYNSGYFFRIAHVSDDGASLILSDVLDFDKGDERYVFGRLDQSGKLTRLGDDLPFTKDTWLGGQWSFAKYAERAPIITADGAFAFTGTHVAQLGSRPVPGTEPTVPSTPVGGDYLEFFDARCITRNLTLWERLTNTGKRDYSPISLSLYAPPVGTDLRPAAGFKGTIKRTSDGASKAISLTPGSYVEIPEAGYRGGFSFDGTVTLRDGTALKYSKVVGSHGAPTDCPYGLFG